MASVSKIPNILVKTVGVAGLGLVGYDSYIAARIHSEAYSKDAKANLITRAYFDDLALDHPSVIKRNLKKGIFHYTMDENITGFFNGIAGGVKGAVSMLVHNWIPATLAAGTFVGKGIFSKCSAVGLVGYGLMVLAQEVFGIGKVNGSITKPF